eukprot:s1247_g4.t1
MCGAIVLLDILSSCPESGPHHSFKWTPRWTTSCVCAARRKAQSAYALLPHHSGTRWGFAFLSHIGVYPWFVTTKTVEGLEKIWYAGLMRKEWRSEGGCLSENRHGIFKKRVSLDCFGLVGPAVAT